MGRQIGSSQSSPSFRSTDLALPLFPGSCMRKPFTRHNPETPMPLTPATLSPSEKFAPAPVASLPTHPVSLLLPRPARPVSEIGDRRFPQSRALPLFALVKRRPAWDPVSGWVQSRCRGVRKALSPFVLVNSAWGFGWWSAGVLASLSGAWKALSQSVLVKRADLALIRCPPAFDQRLAVQCWAGNGLGKQVLGFGSAVAGEVRQARQSVLVKSFSGSGNDPLPPFRDPCAGGGLSGWGVSHA